MPQSREPIQGEITTKGQGGIEDGAAVAFAQDETVPLRPIGTFWIVAEHTPEVKGSDDLHRGEATGGMAGTGLGGASDDVTAEGAGYFLELDKVGFGIRG